MQTVEEYLEWREGLDAALTAGSWEMSMLTQASALIGPEVARSALERFLLQDDMDLYDALRKLVLLASQNTPNEIPEPEPTP